MPMRPFNAGIWASIALAGLAHAHIVAWHQGMYCLDGATRGTINYNNNDPVNPLFEMKYSDYWIHGYNGCDNFPPAEGAFLELPAGKSFTVELAGNRAFTTLGNNPTLSDWGDGQSHPDNWNVPTCITNPNLHTQNQSMAAGTAFAISYESDITKVTPENLVVFSVRYNTPWKRVTSYDVPSGMPACPDAGCHCVVPKECGQPNMYVFPYKCKVIPDSSSPKTIGTPKPPVWCQDDASKCVKGPKQVIIWHQAEGNNIDPTGRDPISGFLDTPAYNEKCGFQDGAQNDIFVSSSTSQVGDTCGHSKRANKRRGKGGIF
ncbi:hypothetical protein JVT61DRAFT_3426 [Boletus reticuloceps]|uniref:Uncharacterized protein n=1 Tax=Boletus reticuloceps TaxID=495285 RepID=A0A8I3A9J3_9AGAM|nr:hypothetical protein JVT61DRAFT_3426 [Boletus reticuloceps]